MKSAWFRWRLAAGCLVAGLLLPVLTVLQALRNAKEIGAKSQVAGDYLRQATFSSDTLIGLS